MATIFDTYLRSVITQSKLIVQKYFSLNPTYKTSVKPLSVFGELPVNLHCSSNIVDLVKKELEINIDLHFIDYESFIKAYTKRFKSRNEGINDILRQEIFVTRNNTCWRRYFICKELCQSFIYAPASMTASSEDINRLLTDIISDAPDSFLDNDEQIAAENVTYFAAIELLLPTVYVDKFLEIKKKGFSNNLIAKKMLVPEKIVDFRLSEDGIGIFDKFDANK